MESKYSKEQQRFLHKIQHLKQYKSLPEESDIVTFMHREKMIDIFFDPSTQQSYCKITEAGKAYLHTLKVSNRWRRIPIIISVIALIISALSIVLSPFFQIYFTKLYGIIGITMDRIKSPIDAIRLPIENHSGKSGCRSSKLSRYPGLSFSKFLISSFESSLPT